MNYNIGRNVPCTFLVKVDGQPYKIGDQPYVIVSASGKVTISGLG